MKSFRDLGVSAPLVKSLAEQGITEPTEIQEMAIPPVLEGKDVIAASKTGSGKTLSFLCGIIQNIEREQKVKALVLAPTRELAKQVAGELEKFSKYYSINIALVYGGVSLSDQAKELRTADVVIATPGRLLDHIGRRNVDLKNVEILVLDEADNMFDMGFIDDVEKIIGYCSKHRQNLLFSATLSSVIDKLADKYMDDPVQIFLEPSVDASKLRQEYYDIPDHKKFSLLVHLLREEKSGLVMVFCNTRRNTDFIVENLKNQGIDATAIHGGLSQQKRNEIMQKFHSGNLYTLVCTDVAARGLDIEGVSHIYNYDIPSDPKQYTHRIGRTARAGKEGKAINILSSRDHDNFRRVMRENSKEMNRMEIPNIKRVGIIKPKSNNRKGGYKGKRRRRN